MKTMQICVCEICDKPLLNPKDGFLCVGNVYVAAPVDGLKLVGGEDQHGHTYCIVCFLNALGFEQVELCEQQLKCKIAQKVSPPPEYVLQSCLVDSVDSKWVIVGAFKDVSLAVDEAKKIVSSPDSVLLKCRARVIKTPDNLIAEFSSDDVCELIKTN